MVKLLKRLLGIEALEKRVDALENSQTSTNSGENKSQYMDVLDEWINGAKEDEGQ